MEVKDRSSRIKEIENRLEEIAVEQKKLVSELTSLRAANSTSDELPPLRGIKACSSVPTLPEDKVQLFLKLFCARESVFPKLWENLSLQVSLTQP